MRKVRIAEIEEEKPGKNPLVSVIMSIYNTKIEYLKAALDSVLEQTWTDMEVIVIDDASESKCVNFLNQYCEEKNDDRIKLYHNNENKGLTACLNIALNKAAGDYIARMDADDICARNRIKRQVEYMEAHKEIDVLSCGTYLYGMNGETGFAGIYRKFSNERMRVRLSMDNIQFTHPAVMFRGSFLKKYGLYYDEAIKKAQDYNMWVRCIDHGVLDCMQEVLFIYRMNEDQISTTSEGEQREFADVTKIKCLERLLPDCTERQKYLYMHMRDTDLVGTSEENVDLIKCLVEANDRKKIYNIKVYREELFFWWFRKGLYRKNRPVGRQILKNPYMKRNIRHIILPQACRHIADKSFELYTKRKWRKIILSDEWQCWMKKFSLGEL